ncbi:MAG: hemerythrin domain-containing protein [bacterium]
MPDSQKRPHIGHDSIDNHHDELFELTTTLDKALQLHSITHVEKIILFLEDYVDSHFKEEETLMQNNNSSHYDYHKEEHDIFKTKVAILRKRFDRGNSIAHIIFSIRELLDDLISHIHHVDIHISTLKEIKKDV